LMIVPLMIWSTRRLMDSQACSSDTRTADRTAATRPINRAGVMPSGPGSIGPRIATAAIATIQPGASAAVTVTVKPSSDALAGDYDVTFTATSGAATGNVDIRTTVQTSPLWGFIGLALIALVIVGLGWVFRRYGRR